MLEQFMYYRITIIILIFGIVFSFTPVFAQEAEEKKAGPAQELRALIKEESETLRANLQEKRIQLQEKIKQEGANLRDGTQKLLQNLKDVSPEERTRIREELRSSRQKIKENARLLRQNLREQAKELRTDFREKVKSLKERVRIAVAHARGLRMLNRFRSAISRFDHILLRLESRFEKLEARGIDVSSLNSSIEQAKNMKVEADVTMEMLKEKYEFLLNGENSQSTGEDAREIAKELKTEVKELHNKLREIVSNTKDIVSVSAEKIIE